MGTEECMEPRGGAETILGTSDTDGTGDEALGTCVPTFT
jgi:hypothetical protein